MKNMFKSLALAFGVAALSVSAMAQDSGPLLDALVKKGVLSDSEAEDIRVNLVKEYNSTSAGKLQISSFVKKLQLFGDARIRYQYQDLQTIRGAGANPNSIVSAENDRYRYRLRVGGTYTYDSHWSATVRLETAAGNDSTNADFGNYWDKNGANDAIKVGQLFLDYKTKFSVFDSTSTVPSGKSFSTVTDPGVAVGFNARIGRGPKQLLLSEAWWDADLNPEGLATELTFDNVGVDGLSFAVRGAAYITDNDNVAAANVYPGSTTVHDDDGALLAAQVEGKYTINDGALKGTEIRVAPLFLQETGGNSNGFQPASSPGNGSAATGLLINGQSALPDQGNLQVVALPVEVNLTAWKFAHRFYGTYGVNLDSRKRLNDMYGAGTHNHGQNTFWNLGYELGKLKKQGDWQAGFEWRWVEAAAYTPNLSDSDWANNGLNQTGFALTTGYNLTDAITLRGTYFHSTPIQAARTASDANATTFNGYGNANFGTQDILQADLNWKF